MLLCLDAHLFMMIIMIMMMLYCKHDGVCCDVVEWTLVNRQSKWHRICQQGTSAVSKLHVRYCGIVVVM